MEHAFGRAPAFRLGMEEELLLVDAGTHALAHVSSQVVPRVQALAGAVKHDVYGALVELASPIVETAADGARHLAGLRDAVRRAGGTLIGSGIPPAGAFGDVRHVDDPRYREIGR